MSDIKKSSREWAKEKKVGGLCCFGEVDPIDRDTANIIVYDPDGWDRKNWEESLLEEITELEFDGRICLSTIMCSRDYLRKLKGATNERD